MVQNDKDLPDPPTTPEGRWAVTWYRLGQIEEKIEKEVIKRISRIEAFILGLLIIIATSVLIALLSVVGLPKP